MFDVKLSVSIKLLWRWISNIYPLCLKSLESCEVGDRTYKDGQFRVSTSSGESKNELYRAETFYPLKMNGEKDTGCFHGHLSMSPVLSRAFSIGKTEIELQLVERKHKILGETEK